MKLSDALASYYEKSAKVSELVRQLAFAGIAVIWAFKVDKENKVPSDLAFPALLMVISLTLDLLQYLYGAIAWGILHRVKEVRALQTKNGSDDDFLVHGSINWPSNILFYGKTLTLITGYYFLAAYLYSRLW